jgi:F0F1-type ATP synthase membrane subunit b/b'
MKKIMKAGLVLAGLAISFFASAQKPAVVGDAEPGWHRIAGLQANFKKQNESVHIMGNDEFKALRFRVEDAAIHIERMQVFYESGDMEDVDVKSEMKAGETSKVFQLKHAGRDITKIAFTYHSVGNAGSDKAELEIYGLKTNADTYDKKVDKAEGDLKEAREEAREEGKEVQRDVKDAADEVEDEADDAENDVDRKAERTENGIERAAEKTGDEVSEAAAKTAAEIDDKRHDTKVGPDGQVVYISDDDRYYYINEEGKKVFITSMQLKDK